MVREVEGKNRLAAIGRGETYRGRVANHLPLAVLGKDPQKNELKISILEIENRLCGNSKNFRTDVFAGLEIKSNLACQSARRHIVRSAER
jgi:hypothetical protein